MEKKKVAIAVTSPGESKADEHNMIELQIYETIH